MGALGKATPLSHQRVISQRSLNSTLVRDQSHHRLSALRSLSMNNRKQEEEEEEGEE